MAHDEKAIETERINFIEMVNNITETVGTPSAPGIANRLKCSGSKIYIDNGTAWKLVTSA